ncbi:MAG TPA: cytochrome c1 [Croceibacterium sp.]|nr:cytochrome c1 [Croceibacterium sp.]
MVRIIGFLVGLFFAGMALWAFGTGLGTVAAQGYLKEKTAESVFHREPKHLALASDGPFGKFDHRQVQRGYQVYKEVCKACHSLNQVAFRDLAELGYDEAEVKAEAASWTVPGIDPNTGETTTRPGVPTDYFPKPFANDIAARAANNNAIPPDLSLMAKAREGGPSYIYSILTGFQPVPAELKKQFPDFETPKGLYYNPYFANLNIAMPPPLTTDGQVQFKDGTPATVDEMARDVAAFLMWTAEPSLDKRHQTGWPVLGFLLFATVLAFLAKKQIWADAKARRD